MVRSHRSSPPRVGVDLRAVVRRPTGIGVYTLALLRELAALGRFELVGLVHREPEARPELERIGVEIEIEPAPLGVLWQQLLLPRRLAAGDLDLFWSPLLTLPRRLPIPAIVTVHDLAVLHVPETLSFKVRWSLLPFLGHSIERASAVVAISEATAREIAHAWPHAAGRIVTIPNGKLADMQIETFAERDRIRLNAVLALQYGATASQLREVLAGIEALLRAHPRVWPDVVVVRLLAFADSSLNVEVMAWFQTGALEEFWRYRQEVLLGFLEALEGLGVKMARPSQTLHWAEAAGALEKPKGG